MRRAIVLAAVVLLIVLIAAAARVASSLGGPRTPPGWETDGVDLHGDPLPAGAVARLGTVRFRTTTSTNALWLDDGRLVAGGFDNEIVVWDAATGERLQVLPGHREMIVLPPKRWDWRDLRRVLEGGEPPHMSDFLDELQLMSDGLTLVSTGAAIRTWDLATGKGRFVAYPGGGNVVGFRLVDDERVLAWTWGEERLRRVDMATGDELERRPLRELDEESGDLSTEDLTDGDVALEPFWGGNGLRLIRMTDGVCRTLVPKADGLWRTTQPRDGVAWYVWTRMTGEEGSRKRISRLTRTRLTSRENLVEEPLADGKRWWSLADSPDGRVLALGTLEGHVELRDGATGELLRVAERPGHAAWDFSFSQDGRRLLCRGAAAVTVYEVATGAVALPRLGHVEPVHTVRFAGPERALTTAGREDTRAWDPRTGRALAAPTEPVPPAVRVEVDDAGAVVLDPDDAPLGRVQFTPLVHAASEGTFAHVVALDATTLRVLLEEETRTPIDEHSYRPTYRLRLVDIATGTDVWTDEGDRAAVAAFSGTLTATGTDGGQAHLRDGAGTLVASLRAEDHGDRSRYGPNGVLVVAFSPAGRRLATGGADHTVRVWSVPDGELLRTLRGHGGRVRCLAWSPDGSLLVSGSDDTSALVWDVAR